MISAQERMYDRERLRRETKETVIDFLTPIAPVMNVMDMLGMRHSFIRYLGTLLLLYEENALVLAMSTEGKIEINDADFLIHYDKPKLDAFRIYMEEMQADGKVKIITWIDSPSCGRDGFTSTSFIQLAILDENGNVVREIDMFSDFEGRSDNHTVRFASLNSVGGAGNLTEIDTSITTGSDLEAALDPVHQNHVSEASLQIPGYEQEKLRFIYGVGVRRSYAWQVQLLRDAIMNGSIHVEDAKPINRMTQLELAEEVVGMKLFERSAVPA